MKFTKFHYVETVAQLRSFSKAAEKLYISQPALTKSIKKLEDELGIKLFDRSSQPIQLTYAGERYLAGMRNILAMQNQLDQELADISNMIKGRLIVGIPNTRGNPWLPAILPPFLRDYPGIDLQIVEGTTGSLEHSLVREDIDLAVTISLPQMLPNLAYEEIHQEQLMILASPKHPMFRDLDLTQAMQARNALHYIRPQRLDGQPFIAASSDQGLFRSAVQLFERFSVHPKKIMTISNTSTASTLAAEGLGFVITPTHTAYAARLAKRALIFCSISDPPMYRSIIVSYKRGRSLSAAARRFIDITLSAARSVPAVQPTVFPLLHDLEG